MSDNVKVLVHLHRRISWSALLSYSTLRRYCVPWRNRGSCPSPSWSCDEAGQCMFWVLAILISPTHISTFLVRGVSAGVAKVLRPSARGYECRVSVKRIVVPLEGRLSIVERRLKHTSCRAAALAGPDIVNAGLTRGWPGYCREESWNLGRRYVRPEVGKGCGVGQERVVHRT